MRREPTDASDQQGPEPHDAGARGAGQHIRKTECKKPGVLAPLIDRNRCEGKADCVRVCPYAVFEIGRIRDEDFAQLSFLGKLKSRAHRRQTAYTPRASECHSCGLCVSACPEKAIQLARPD